MGVTDAIPALLAGNAVLEKPDSQTPFTLLWALDLLVDCGLPEDLYQVVCGDGPTLGPAIFDASDYVQFTGSTATGRHVAREAGARLIGCSLELGGKNPMLVLADADLDARGGRRGAQLLRLGRAALRLDRAALRARVAATTASSPTSSPRRGSSGSASDSTGATRSARSSPRSSSPPSPRTSTTRSRKGARVEAGGKPRPDLGPLFFEPTDPHRRAAGDDALRRGDVRTGGRGLPVRFEPRGDRARQRHALRPQRLDLVAGHRARAADGDAARAAAR